MKTLLTAVN